MHIDNYKMKKKYIVIVIVILSIVPLIWNVLNNRHSFRPMNGEKYIWLFSDSVKNELDLFYTIGLEGRHDSKYNYLLGGHTYINIWEFESLNLTNLNDVVFAVGSNLEKTNFFFGETLDKNLQHGPTVRVKFGFALEDGILIETNESSDIHRSINGPGYKGFLADINIMTVSDKNGSKCILFEYENRKEPSLVLVLLHKCHLILIVVNSEKEFDESILKIFSFSNKNE